jgi:hypothetical protein
MWDFDKRFGTSTDNLEKNMDEEPSAHNRLVFNKKKPVGRFASRSFLSSCVWRALDGGGFLLVTSPEETQRRSPEEGVVRATYPSTLKIKPLGNDSSMLEYVIHPDAGGAIPPWAMNLVIGKSLARVIQAQEYFQARRGWADWREEDGRCTGEFCLMKTKEEKHHGKGETRVEARVRAMMENHKGLIELGEKHEWFSALLAKVVANKLRPAGDSKAKLCNMSVKQANIIGGALASSIAANLTAPAAVDEWILRYPAMGELDREYVRERSERNEEERQRRAKDRRQQPREQNGRQERASAPKTDANNRASKAGAKSGRARQQAHTPTSGRMEQKSTSTTSFACTRFARAPTTFFACVPASDANKRAEGAGERSRLPPLVRHQASSLALDLVVLASLALRFAACARRANDLFLLYSLRLPPSPLRRILPPLTPLPPSPPRYVWFRPMIDTIAQRLLESVSWGLAFRLYTGAGLSMADLFTDLFMIYAYMTTGQQGTGTSLAIMVGLCVMGQLLTVWLQSRKGPRLAMLKEMFIVLAGVAPGIHAMRVANGQKQSEHEFLPSEHVLGSMRAFEMVFESIPGSILQCGALLDSIKRGERMSKAALASVVVSALTTGFAGATMSFE